MNQVSELESVSHKYWMLVEEHRVLQADRDRLQRLLAQNIAEQAVRDLQEIQRRDANGR